MNRRQIISKRFFFFNFISTEPRWIYKTSSSQHLRCTTIFFRRSPKKPFVLSQRLFERFPSIPEKSRLVIILIKTIGSLFRYMSCCARWNAGPRRKRLCLDTRTNYDVYSSIRYTYAFSHHVSHTQADEREFQRTGAPARAGIRIRFM